MPAQVVRVAAKPWTRTPTPTPSAGSSNTPASMGAYFNSSALANQTASFDVARPARQAEDLFGPYPRADWSKLDNLNDRERALLGVPLPGIINRYLTRYTDLTATVPPDRAADFDVLAGDAMFAWSMDDRPAEDQALLRTSLDKALRFGSDVRLAARDAIEERPELRGYVEQVVADDIEAASGLIAESRDPYPFYRLPSDLIDQAVHRQQVYDAERVSDDARLAAGRRMADIDNAYSVKPRSEILGVPFRNLDNVQRLAAGHLIFTGPNAMYAALKYAPRADEQFISGSRIHSSGFRLGPIDAPLDAYNPRSVRFEDPELRTRLAADDDRRLRRIFIVGNAYSIDNGRTWAPNVFSTDAAQEQAKLDAGRRLVQAANRALH